MKITLQILAAASILSLAGCAEAEQNSATANSNTIQPLNTQQAAGTVALNPAHGQPNHRCDIPVGAPLDAPAQPNLNAPQPTFTPPVSKEVVATGINPPHGQPGHDCAVPVGAQLNN
jgi:hypothetical protein